MANICTEHCRDYITVMFSGIFRGTLRDAPLSRDCKDFGLAVPPRQFYFLKVSLRCTVISRLEQSQKNIGHLYPTGRVDMVHRRPLAIGEQLAVPSPKLSRCFGPSSLRWLPPPLANAKYATDRIEGKLGIPLSLL